MTKGVHVIPAADYHADCCPAPSLSASIACVLVEESPLHAWHQHPRLNPNYRRHDEDANKVTDLGTAAHYALLDRDLSRVVFVEAKNWKKKDAQTLRKVTREAGGIALLEHQRADLKAMVAAAERAVEESDDLQGVLQTGEAERVLCWQEDGIWFRSRIDLLHVPSLIVDYKGTAGSARPDNFIRGPLASKQYDLKAAFYQRAVRAVYGVETVDFFWLVQEFRAPFACSIVGLGQQMRELGEQKVEYAIRTWGECLRSGNWPGYGRRTHWAEPTPWSIGNWAEQAAMAAGEIG